MPFNLSFYALIVVNGVVVYAHSSWSAVRSFFTAETGSSENEAVRAKA
ncbi:hypothetical protein [Thalassobacillus sp. C254]|nr:hypothetical protein [Thalassobacillus sp. C254]